MNIADIITERVVFNFALGKLTKAKPFRLKEDTLIKIIKILSLVFFIKIVGVSCLEGAQSQSGTGIFDLDQLEVFYPGSGYGLSKTFKWKHVPTGKYFLSLNIDGFDNTTYEYMGEGGNVYSSKRPQPEKTLPIYLSFDDKGKPYLDIYSRSLSRTNKSNIDLEFLGYLPKKRRVF
jgi:hypothetical protein